MRAGACAGTLAGAPTVPAAAVCLQLSIHFDLGGGSFFSLPDPPPRRPPPHVTCSPFVRIRHLYNIGDIVVGQGCVPVGGSTPSVRRKSWGLLRAARVPTAATYDSGRACVRSVTLTLHHYAFLPLLPAGPPRMTNSTSISLPRFLLQPSLSTSPPPSFTNIEADTHRRRRRAHRQ